MTEQSRHREAICRFAQSLYARGLTHGSTGNISVRLSSGEVLVTPTGSSFGFLDPADIALLGPDGRHLSGAAPTKELPLHAGFYAVRGSAAGAVVHLHSHHAVRLSVQDDLDPEDVLPNLTPYATMQLGRVRLLPYFRPGDPAMGAAVRALDPATSAVILANHGPVVAGATLHKTVFAMEELEATARLAIETRGARVRALSHAQIADLVAAFDLEV